MEATLELGGGIKLEIHAQSLAEKSATFKLDGSLDFAELAALLPPAVKFSRQITEGT